MEVAFGGVEAGPVNWGWRCVQCERVSSQSLQSAGRESSLERRPIIPSSSVTLPTDFQCKHVDSRLLGCFVSVLREDLTVFER